MLADGVQRRQSCARSAGPYASSRIVPVTRRHAVDRHHLKATFDPVPVGLACWSLIGRWSRFLSGEHPAATGTSSCWRWRATCGRPDVHPRRAPMHKHTVVARWSTPATPSSFDNRARTRRSWPHSSTGASPGLREIGRGFAAPGGARQALTALGPGGPARIAGTYSSSWMRPSKVRLLIISSATSG